MDFFEHKFFFKKTQFFFQLKIERSNKHKSKTQKISKDIKSYKNLSRNTTNYYSYPITYLEISK